MSRTTNIAQALIFGLFLIGAILSLAACGSIQNTISDEVESSTTQSSDSDDVVVSTQATLERVIDGDTIAVTPTDALPATNEAGTEHSVRLLGIDAPEMDWDHQNHQCGAAEATAALESLLEQAETVNITFDPHADQTDHYDRSLAYIRTDTIPDVNAEMLEAGLVAAWYPDSAPETTRASVYEQLQDAAQSSQTGSWASCDTMGR